MLSQQRLTPAQWQASVKKMRGWGAQLEDGDADLLARYLAARYPVDAPEAPVPEVDAAAAAAALAPQQDGPFARGDAALGAREFATLCAPCHGKDARGSHPGPNLVDRPILYRAQDVAAIVRNGRGQMPPQGVTDPVIAAIIAWLRTLERP
jgi:mono/diheme cytochrome c family protein